MEIKLWCLQHTLNVTRDITRSIRDHETNSQLELPLGVQELFTALQSMQGCKAPGIDGLTVEFYKAYWNILAHDLLDVFNESLATGSLPLSCRRTVTALCPPQSLPHFLTFVHHFLNMHCPRGHSWFLTRAAEVHAPALITTLWRKHLKVWGQNMSVSPIFIVTYWCRTVLGPRNQLASISRLSFVSVLNFVVANKHIHHLQSQFKLRYFNLSGS